ncbi:methyl-accepting chemotaxis protein [Thiosulfativibrio zosterae]|uniref:Methyl-accepting chemotaxis protein n=1 Tax=Thiosulfativibrio zosterae TaxID=2675053 RepID=A0A6F8PJW2_9GAMM|nr:methyl-accepting chemotaxis protein [Thiosulfativibrio zosterae]BBP42290.1 hypothetical protein THMIRHAT_00360 [Thiosulfativibrio zosterae]
MQTQNLSIKAKVLFISSIVGVLVAFIAGMTMYISIVKPVPQQIEQTLLKEMTNYIQAQVDLKVQGGILAGTAITLQKGIIDAMAVEEREALLPFFENIKENYAKKTNYKNIRSQLITADGRSLIRSWDLDNYGQNVANNPLIQEVMKDKQAVGSLGIGALGVAVVGISPIFENEDFVGMVTIIQGLASVAKTFKKDKDGDWLLLVDKRYIQEKYGKMPVVENNEPVGDNYLIASNKWFNPEALKEAQTFYRPVEADQNAIYLMNGHLYVDIPAFDEENKVFGRHLFIMPETVYTTPINEAIFDAWVSLGGVVFGILLLTFTLVIAIIKMVATPLTKMQQATTHILETGDFSIRAPVNSGDEVGKTAMAINSLLTQVSQALAEANQTVGAIAKGDLSKRISGDYHGDLNTLKMSVNHSVDNIALVIKELARVMKAMREGQFDIAIQNNTSGEYHKMMADAQQAMTETNGIIRNINEVMGYMRQGKFKHRVEVFAPGELDVLKQSINQSMASIDEALADITRVVVAQSEGDLTQVISAEYHGDLRLLKEAVNQSVSKLSEIVHQAVTAAGIVNSEAEEVSKGALDLSSRVQRQAAALEETSATMDEMNSAVQNNTENAQQVSQVVQKVQGESVQATQVMQKTIVAMNAIQQSSHKISEIVTLIDSIAFQTNLLALNAAVEAARAGDHGRGFAVVAGEVRNLAQKSADAAKDIKSLINESVARIDEGTHLATESGEVINGITQLIDEVTLMIKQIAKASAEQAEGVDQVHKAVNEIDATTQQNAALVEETSAAAESMSDQATELSRNMAFFKTNHSQTRQVTARPSLAAPKSPAKPQLAVKSGTKPATKPLSIENKSKAQDPETWEDF